MYKRVPPPSSTTDDNEELRESNTLQQDRETQKEASCGENPKNVSKKLWEVIFLFAYVNITIYL